MISGIHHFLVDHSAPCLPPKLLHNYCLRFWCNFFSWGGGGNKVYYGLCKNGEWPALGNVSLLSYYSRESILFPMGNPCIDCSGLTYIWLNWLSVFQDFEEFAAVSTSERCSKWSDGTTKGDSLEPQFKVRTHCRYMMIQSQFNY